MVDQALQLTDAGLASKDVISVARGGRRVVLADSAVDAVRRSRDIIESMIDNDEPVYGITTGFGSLAGTFIDRDQREALQQNLIRSHAAGMGDPIEKEVVRAMMLLRGRTLAMGFSGARLEVVQSLIDILNAGIVPFVPEYGSLGASGDLAPLAHVALVLSGEGSVMSGNGVRSAAEALEEHGIAPITFQAKDGVSLINGTDGILGMLVMANEDIRALLATAEVAAAMTIEALLGTDRPFAKDLHDLRPHRGQKMSAAHLLLLLEGSEIVATHRDARNNYVCGCLHVFLCRQNHGCVRGRDVTGQRNDPTADSAASRIARSRTRPSTRANSGARYRSVAGPSTCSRIRR